MKTKIVLALVFAALAAWFFHFSRKMTEAQIHKQYEVEAKALANLDGDYLCGLLATDYKATDVTFTSAGPEENTMDKEEACEDIADTVKVFQRLSDATGGMLVPTFDNKIIKVTLSEGGKLATVEGMGTIKMSERLLTRTKYTEKLIRRSGRILHLGGKSQSWVYDGG